MTEHDSPLPPLSSLVEHRSWVRAVARRLVRDEHAAEDLAQDAWVQTMRSPPAADRDPRPWLRRVLENLASNRRRGAGRRRRHEHAWRDQRAQRSPASLVTEAEQHRRLVSHVLDLEEPFRTVLVLRFYEGLTPPQIAARTDAAVGTVHSRLSRATARLRARLDDEEQGDRKAWIAALLPLADARGVPHTAMGAGATVATAGALMSFTKSNSLWLGGLLLAALVAGGFHLIASISSEDDTRTGTAPMLTADGATARPELVPGAALLGDAAVPPVAEKTGAPDAVQPARPRTWRGRVFDKEGRTVAGASVFALPRGARGVFEEDLQEKRFGNVQTDAEGRFQIPIGDIDRPRLVAWSDDLLPTSVPLEGRDPADPLRLVMGPTRWLHVRLQLPLDASLMDLSYRLETTEEGYEFTDDPSLQGLAMFLDEPGVHRDDADLTIRLNTAAPIRVQLDPPKGFAAVPRSLVMNVGDQPPTIRVVHSATVRYELVDAVSEAAIGPGARMYLRVWDAGSEELVASRSWNNAAFELDSELSPGRYRYELRVISYEALRGVFQVQGEGEMVKGRLALRPQTTRTDFGRLVLQIERGDAPSEALRTLAATGGRPASRGRLTAFVRRHGTSLWFPTDARMLEDGRLLIRPSKRPTREWQFPPGRYDLYVASRDTGLAGSLTGVEVFDDRDSHLGIRLEPGTFFRLADALGADAPMRDLDLRAGGLERMPALEYSRGGFTVFLTESNLQELLQIPRRNRLLGPFPAGTLEIRATDENGHRKTIRVSGANVIKGK